MKHTTECPKCHTKLTKEQIGTGIHDCNPPDKKKPKQSAKRSTPVDPGK